MPKLTVIILSYNTKDITKQCIESLITSVDHDRLHEYEIIVIDNDSKDGSSAMLEAFQKHADFPHIHFKLIRNKTNTGYPKGNNQGLKIAEGEYILFLNSDVIIDKINFNQLFNYLDSRPEVGVLTVKVLLKSHHIDPASHRGFPSLWNSFTYFLKLEKFFGSIHFINKLVGGYHLTWHDLGSIHEIDSPSGAFYLTRKSIMDKVKGFDEDFFMYGEDLDLSYRIKKLGYRILYYPLYRVLHLKYASGLNTKDTKVREKVKSYFYDAMGIFYRKHYERRYPNIINRLVYSIIRIKR